MLCEGQSWWPWVLPGALARTRADPLIPVGLAVAEQHPSHWWHLTVTPLRKTVVKLTLGLSVVLADWKVSLVVGSWASCFLFRKGPAPSYRANFLKAKATRPFPSPIQGKANSAFRVWMGATLNILLEKDIRGQHGPETCIVN